MANRHRARVNFDLGDDPEALKELASEIKELSQKKKASETALDELKGQESMHTDVEDAIDDLKERLESFRRGFTKATAMTKKSLIQGLVYAINVTPKGLQIEYRLKHGLNVAGTGQEPDVPPVNENNVISLESHRQEQRAVLASGPGAGNLCIVGSRVEGYGRGRGTQKGLISSGLHEGNSF